MPTADPRPTPPVIPPPAYAPGPVPPVAPAGDPPVAPPVAPLVAAPVAAGTHAAARAVIPCVSCDDAVAGHYCPTCGERRADERPRTTAELLAEAWDAVFSVDGRLLRSLRTLIARPGALTVAHMRGERVRWVGPLRLFLVANLLWFAGSSVLGNRAFTTPLAVHVQPGATPHADVARRLVQSRLTERRTPWRFYSTAFDAAYQTRSRSLLVLLVPMIAVGVAAVGHRRRSLAHHVVFAFHVTAAVLLYSVALYAVFEKPLALWMQRGGRPVDWGLWDAWGSAAGALMIGTYTATALRRAYDLTRRRAVLGALAMIVTWFVAIQLYRTLLFFLTFWMT